MDIDFAAIEAVFRKAEYDTLLEHEMYAVLQAMGVQTPRHLFLPAEGRVSDKDLSDFPGRRLVLKVVSPGILHKSDVGGVRFVTNDPEAANLTIAAMQQEVPVRYLTWVQQKSAEANTETDLSARPEILGTLILEAVEFEQVGFGSELLLGLRNSRDFGPIVSLGTGGLDVEYLNARLKEGRALAICAAHSTDPDTLLDVLRPLAFYDKLTAGFRGHPALVSELALSELFRRFLSLAGYFSPFSTQSDFVIEEAEVNPFVIRGGTLVPLDGLCRISRAKQVQAHRPYADIRFLLEPQSLGIIGVSEKMNIGHVILNNILKQGYVRDKITIVKPGASEIEGCRCVPRIADMPESVDLFVLTISAEQGFEVMQELIREHKARSVIIIAGGMGEKEGTENIEHSIKQLIQQRRQAGSPAPVVNGGNCLGIFSRPGQYDTTFVPEHKIFALPRCNVRPVPLAYLSQSGAYMISRMSQIPGIEPRYAVSIGNQIDLTISDYLNYFKNRDDVRVFALYIEGFLPGDGLTLAQVAQEITRLPGRAVVVYKAGRSPEGQAATASHTASVAGEYPVSRAVLEQAGVFMAQTIDEFEATVKGLCFLAEKKVRGPRVALISNAGFECVIMSDSLAGEPALDLARFSQETQNRLSAILEPLGITRLQDIRNPMDVTPVADDLAFCSCVQAILADEHVDCAVVSPLPMSPAMNTLAAAPYHREDLMREGSTPRRLIDIFENTDKPFVVSIDSGVPYQPMKDMLENAGIPVFRRCDAATQFLRRYVYHLWPQRSGD